MFLRKIGRIGLRLLKPPIRLLVRIFGPPIRLLVRIFSPPIRLLGRLFVRIFSPPIRLLGRLFVRIFGPPIRLLDRLLGPYIRPLVSYARKSLFSSPRDITITLVASAVAIVGGFFILKFVLVDAYWFLITENLRLFFLGTYDPSEEWRVWIPLIFFITLVGATLGGYGVSLKRYAIILSIILVVFFILGLEFIPRWLNAFSFGLAIPLGGILDSGVTWSILFATLVGSLAVAAGSKRFLSKHRTSPVFNPVFMLLWALLILTVLLSQIGISETRWNSFFLDVSVFSVGGLLSFPIGVFLALGRTSPYPVIRYSSTAYIEVVRAAPLVVWLILALSLWNDFLFETNKVHRGMLVFGFFGGAYVSEVIRGGLQSIPRGQYEASRALGLHSFTVYAFIILPQAIRAVIPSLVGRFIAIWKDTTLLLTLTLLNTLEISTSILERASEITGIPNSGFFLEVYIVIAFLYWIVSFVLSRMGKRAEQQLNL